MTNLLRRMLFLVACTAAISCGPKAGVTITTNVGDHGTLRLDPAGPYAVGTVVTLTATPASGYVVGSWTGTDNDASKAAVNQLTITANTPSVGVTFALVVGGPFHLTLPSTTPNGTLSASPVEPSGGYMAGAVVTLTAVPASGYMLGAWTGTDNPASTSLTNQITMAANETVGVTFVPVAYLLTLQTVGNVTLAASSSVPSQPGPSYSAGTVVTLTATLGAAGHKVNWTGTANDASTASTNSVTIGSAPTTVTAASACDSQCTLTIVNSDPSDGHVVATDASHSLNVSTGTNASTQIQSAVNATITLTAHEDVSNWPFQGWSAPAVSTGTCTGTISMTVDRTVSASFPLGSTTNC